MKRRLDFTSRCYAKLTRARCFRKVTKTAASEQALAGLRPERVPKISEAVVVAAVVVKAVAPVEEANVVNVSP